MTFLVYTLHVLICFFLIAVVLLQQGKGADLSVFGGGGTQTAFGARGAATVLHKMTVGSFIAFIVTTLFIGVLQTREDSSEVFSDLPEAAATAEAEQAVEEAEGALPTDVEGEEPAADDAVAGDDAVVDDTGAADAGEAETTAGDSPDTPEPAPADDPGADDATAEPAESDG